MDQSKDGSSNGKHDAIDKLENASSSDSNTASEKRKNGILLVPQPSDDPRDPLVCASQ